MCFAAAIPIALSAVSAISGSQAQGDAADENARLLRANAGLADFNASDAIARGKIDEQLYRRDVKQLKGSQRAAIGASGFETSGDLTEIIAQTAQMGEFGALTIRTNAAREAYGYRMEGRTGRAQARNAQSAGRAGSRNTLLTGAAQAYGIYAESR